MVRSVCLVFSLSSAVLLNAQSPPALKVDASASRHPISPLIYGINEWPSYSTQSGYTDSGMSEAMRVGVRRWGGNNATSYNWQLDLKNNDNDWYFSTYLVGDSITSTFDVFHEQNLRTGTVSLGTVPVMDWTPKMPPPGTPSVGGVLSCSYSVAKYGAQIPSNAMNCSANPSGSSCAVDPYDSDCGSGFSKATGQPVVNDPNDVYQPMTPAFAEQWVQSIVSKYGAANDGGVEIWSLDNEPEWWNSTHMDIYPNPATYDDMTARNIASATAVKTADPTALVTGPVEAGWPGMLFSKEDIQSGWNTCCHYQYWANPIDQNAHGGVPWLQYYLKQMQKFEQTNGYRLLDYLDVHAYITPEALTVNTGSAGDATMETLRLTSTRALWDPTYIVPIAQIPSSGDPCDDYNAICDATGTQVPPMLIRNMSQWAANDYPGTKLAITEYNWGALDSITGAVAQADILGIFGREGLDLGTIWPSVTLTPSVPGAFAFQIFLNYDGNGNQFGETSVSASTTDPDTLSIFAAQRSDTALTILVLNKTSAAITNSVSIANFAPAGTLQTFQYSSANLSAIVPGTAAISGNSISATFPAYSMTLFVLPAAQSMMTVPQPIVNWVKNAASWNASAIAPGEVVAIQGTSVGPAQQMFASSSSQLGTSLGGVSVLFNGTPGAMIYTTPISGNTQQLAVVVPYEIAANPATTSVNVQVEVQGNSSIPFPIPVTTALPGLFTNDYSGLGQAAALNQDTVNGQTVITRNGPLNPSASPPTQPATRGSYILLYATGEGQTSPPGVDGRIATSIFPAPVLSCSVSIGSIAVTPVSCGATPNSTAGELQVKAQVPMGVTPGNNVPVQVTIGNVISPAGVTIAVQ
jgi:uncharacterized protein (TIGR03437 family)